MATPRSRRLSSTPRLVKISPDVDPLSTAKRTRRAESPSSASPRPTAMRSMRAYNSVFVEGGVIAGCSDGAMKERLATPRSQSVRECWAIDGAHPSASPDGAVQCFGDSLAMDLLQLADRSADRTRGLDPAAVHEVGQMVERHSL